MSIRLNEFVSDSIQHLSSWTMNPSTAVLTRLHYILSHFHLILLGLDLDIKHIAVQKEVLLADLLEFVAFVELHFKFNDAHFSYPRDQNLATVKRPGGEVYKCNLLLGHLICFLQL